MRENYQPASPRISTTFTWALGLFLMAGIAGAADEHLPAKAKSVAAKFESYQKTARPEAVETKRRQVIAYLGTILKEEASEADLDGALAVKALMAQIGARGRAKAAPALTKKREGLPRQDFLIDTEAKRRLEFRFHIERDLGLKTLRVEIAGASDDSGDRGLAYELVDPRGKVVKAGKLTSSEAERIVHPAKAGGTWKIVLIDADTALEGTHPGNSGSIGVDVVRGEALADAR